MSQEETQEERGLWEFLTRLHDKDLSFNTDLVADRAMIDQGNKLTGWGLSTRRVVGFQENICVFSITTKGKSSLALRRDELLQELTNAHWNYLAKMKEGALRYDFDDPETHTHIEACRLLCQAGCATEDYVDEQVRRFVITQRGKYQLSRHEQA